MCKIGYLGPAGTFSEQAALYFAQSCPGELIAYSDVPELILAVQSGALHYAVVPIENVLEGTVNVTVDILAHDTNLVIVGEQVLPIHQCLLAPHGAGPDEIRRIVSHPQALAQCRHFLRVHFPDIPVHSANSTAAGALEAKNSSLPVAAIANKRAAEIFGLNILMENIEDQPNNCTRFIALSRQGVGATGRDKTSIVFSVNNEPGSLLQALAIFAQLDLNLTRIESRPMRTQLGQYLFFVDFEGHAEDKAAARALHLVKAMSTYFRHLGSYPRSE
ncbi:MAG: prephenate dehydratase [Caldicoprobacterales bacterium]|jgi:prephenate dehydratase|nr:prephenate dehydratase [Clostridiales bacterium]